MRPVPEAGVSTAAASAGGESVVGDVVVATVGDTVVDETVGDVVVATVGDTVVDETVGDTELGEVGDTVVGEAVGGLSARAHPELPGTTAPRTTRGPVSKLTRGRQKWPATVEPVQRSRHPAGTHRYRSSPSSTSPDTPLQCPSMGQRMRPQMR